MGDILITGRGMAPGTAAGTALVCNQTISPLGEMSKSGLIVSGPCENKSFKNKILVFKGGRGSTVGSYVLLELKNNNIAPAGIINEEAEQVVLTGAIISEIPMIDKVPIDIFADGDFVEMDGKRGTIKITNLIEKEAVAIYLLNKDGALFLERSDKSLPFQSEYNVILKYNENNDTLDLTATHLLTHEYGLSDVRIIKEGDLIYLRNGNILTKITPILMETLGDTIISNKKDNYTWIAQEDLDNYDFPTKLRETFFRLNNQE